MDSEYYSSGLKRERGNDSMQVENGMGDSDAKKAKFESNGPSKVVHIRALPNNCTEVDVIHLGMPFGKMKNIMMYKNKSQAFLEFFEEANAVAMVNCCNNNNAFIKQRPVYVQFSNHKELKIDNNPQNNSALVALQAAQGLLGASPLSCSAGENTILRVIVDNILYPVTLDVLHQLFSRFGKIMKIVTFTKNNIFQALVQYTDSVSAATAKDSLDSQNIYNGCNTLRIDFSRLTQLEVKFNNDRMRDFTNPNLPTGDGLNNMGMSGGLGGNMGGAGLLGSGGFNFNPMGNMGMANRMGSGMGSMGASGGEGCCILAYNLNQEKVNPDALFNLFGCYGDVHRVKILFNKKDNALIQMADPSQAQKAMTFLDNAKLWGRDLRLAPSIHSHIQMPREGKTDAGLTKDFVNARHHRFKNSKSKNYIFPPTAVLHLYNVQDLEEDDIRDMFSEYGTIAGFKFFDNDKKMALIKMSSVEEATHALIGLHNYQVGDSLHLRVSFSKSTL